MLKNQYTAFGNEIMEKYAGMVSAINPLSLFYLRNDQEQEDVQKRPASVTYVQNQIYKVSHHQYNTVANRYMINYHNTVQTISSNPVYVESPNFRQDIRPVSFVHAKQEEKEAEKLTKPNAGSVAEAAKKAESAAFDAQKAANALQPEKLRDMLRSVLKELTGQTTMTILEKSSQLETRILPVLEKAVSTVWKEKEGKAEKEIRTQLVQSLTAAIQQVVKRLPDEARKQILSQKGQNLRTAAAITVTKEETDRLAERLIKELTLNEQHTKMSGKQQTERLKEQQTEEIPLAVQSSLRIAPKLQSMVLKPGTGLLKGQLQNVILRQQNAKERFQAQVMGRLNPLPVRPVTLIFPKEEMNTENAPAVLQKVNYVIQKEQQAEYKYYTHFLEKFLNNQETQKAAEPDRSELPAGIIWHKKPKESISFERRDILQVPMELVYEKPHREAATEGMKTAVETESVKAAVGTKTAKTSGMKAESLMDSEKSSASHYYDDTGYQTRRLVRRELPEFTGSVSQNVKAFYGETPSAQILYDWKMGSLELVLPKAADSAERTAVLERMIGSAAAESGVTAENSVLRAANFALVDSAAADAKRESKGAVQNPASAMRQSLQKVDISAFSQGPLSLEHTVLIPAQLVNLGEGTAEHNVYGAPAGQRVTGQTMTGPGNAGPSPIGQTPAVWTSADRTTAGYPTAGLPAVSGARRRAAQALDISPMALLYKQEQAQDDLQKAPEANETEETARDIVFEKKTVSRQTEKNEFVVEHTGSDAVNIPGTPITGSAGGSSHTLVSRAEVDGIISEKVSRHVDENLAKISRQVYRDIERQLKKERERRGL
ncbi:MAG: hypothetical protein IJ390_09425 [Lachnospiraceae bacterium]|nr:hypothetical protein [Lachnospiraceae bacterium]